MNLGESPEETQKKKGFSRAERDCLCWGEESQGEEKRGEGRRKRERAARPKRCHSMMSVSVVMCVNWWSRWATLGKKNNLSGPVFSQYKAVFNHPTSLVQGNRLTKDLSCLTLCLTCMFSAALPQYQWFSLWSSELPTLGLVLDKKTWLTTNISCLLVLKGHPSSWMVQ